MKLKFLFLTILSLTLYSVNVFAQEHSAKPEYLEAIINASKNANNATQKANANAAKIAAEEADAILKSAKEAYEKNQDNKSAKKRVEEAESNATTANTTYQTANHAANAAQTEADSAKSAETKAKALETISQTPNELLSIISLCKTDIENKNKRIDSLEIIAKKKKEQDSVIILKNKKIAELEGQMDFVDRCMVNLANRWLFMPFNKAEIEEAKKFFDKIYSSQLKEKYSIVQELIDSYESAYIEFQIVLREAQEDGKRKSNFPSHKQEYKTCYKNKIENMKYYQKYYKQSWNIKYLNKKIDEALNLLNNHPNFMADFSKLIDTDEYVESECRKQMQK